MLSHPVGLRREIPFALAPWITVPQEPLAHTAAMWFGACIFLVVVATVIKSFFGL